MPDRQPQYFAADVILPVLNFPQQSKKGHTPLLLQRRYRYNCSVCTLFVKFCALLHLSNFFHTSKLQYDQDDPLIDCRCAVCLCCW